MRMVDALNAISIRACSDHTELADMLGEAEIADGLEQAGEYEEAAPIVDDRLTLIEKNDFAEYYDPNTAETCWGGSITWAAAMVIELLTHRKEAE
jgi:deoxyribose-phosphate aldolase